MIKQLRQQLADLTAKGKALLAKAESENRVLTAEEMKEHAGIVSQAAGVSEQIKVVEAQMDLEREVAGAAFDARRNSGAQVRDRSEDDPNGGFQGHRDFLMAVMNAGQGQIDTRLERFRSARFRATQGSDEHSTLSDPYGGFLVPTSVLPGILMVNAEQDPLLGRVQAVPMRTPIVQINSRVDKDHSSSVSGGLVVTRRAETSDGSSSRMETEPVVLEARELFGFSYASESVLSDSPESFLALLNAGFGDEFGNNAINERINGNGNGQFLGVLNAPATISISKETGQAGSTIQTENIDAMVARCWRYGQAVWLANHTTRPQLRGLVRVVGTGGSVVEYFKENNGTETLDGRPIFFTEWCKTLGTVGDLILGNWSQYLEGEYQPMQQAESIHVRFLSNQRTFKFWKRNAGQPWWKSALTPKNGNTLSPFVTLATRS